MVYVGISVNDMKILAKWREKRARLVLCQTERFPSFCVDLADRIRTESDEYTLHSILTQFEFENIPEVDLNVG